MSYCRYNGTDSEVYVIKHISGHLECIACRITGEPASDGLRYGTFTCEEPGDMLEHLWEHRNQGWKVPSRAMDRLLKEMGMQND